MQISVIIPTFNEEKTIAPALENLLLHHDPNEVIVVDGGSEDNTVSLASRWTKVVSAPKGRARQMNEGARHAKGDIYLFLHADTRLPQKALERIREKFREGHEAGRFRMQFDDARFLLRLYASYTRFHFFSYGDQAFFVKRGLFEQLGGFREEVPFEDIDFYRRIRKAACPVILPDKVTTSARRFTQMGCLRQKWMNLFLVALYDAGLDVFRWKKQWYPEVR